MELEAVIRFEFMGLSCGLYRIMEEGKEIGWQVVSTSTYRVIPAISFEHGRHILDGCITEIRNRAGYNA